MRKLCSPTVAEKGSVADGSGHHHVDVAGTTCPWAESGPRAVWPPTAIVKPLRCGTQLGTDRCLSPPSHGISNACPNTTVTVPGLHRLNDALAGPDDSRNGRVLILRRWLLVPTAWSLEVPQPGSPGDEALVSYTASAMLAWDKLRTVPTGHTTKKRHTPLSV